MWYFCSQNDWNFFPQEFSLLASFCLSIFFILHTMRTYTYHDSLWNLGAYHSNEVCSYHNSPMLRLSYHKVGIRMHRIVSYTLMEKTLEALKKEAND